MRNEKQQRQEHNEAEEHEVMTIETDSVTVEESFSAKIQGQQDVEIYPQVPGTIARILVKEGQEVRKNQVLFEIDKGAYEAAWKQTVANVKVAEAHLEQAKLERYNQKVLSDNEIVSQSKLKEADISLQAALAALEQAKAAEYEAHNNLSYTTIVSPANGYVGSLPYSVGALVSPQIAKPLTTVSDCRNMWVYFSLSEKTLRDMQRPYGGRKKMIEAMPIVSLRLSDGTMYEKDGRIESISGALNPATGSVQVRCVFPNPDGELLSGSVGDIVIRHTNPKAIIVPKSCTYEIQDHIYVGVVENGVLRKQQILVDRVNDGASYIVRDGLKEGDIILSEDASLLREGTRITTRE